MLENEKMHNWTISERPTKLSDLYGLDNIKTYFYKCAKDNSYPKATLLRGCFGNGKSSTAKIMAQMINCTNPQQNGDPCGECSSCKSIIEERYDRDTVLIDGGQSGKSDLIQQIDELIQSPPFYDKKRVIIIEEIQELSTAAKNSLLKTLEQPRDWIHFILLTMENSGLSGFASRCVPFNFKKLDIKQIMFFLKGMMEKQGLWEDESIPKEFKMQGLATIAQTCGGSIRQALQILQLCISCQYFTAQQIEENTGYIDQQTVTNILLKIANCDDTVWTDLGRLEPMDFFALGLKIVSDASVYSVSKTLPGETTDFFLKQASGVAAHKNFKEMVVLFKNMAAIAKPFLRKSEMFVLIAEYFEKCQSVQKLNEVAPQRDVPVRTRVVR